MRRKLFILLSLPLLLTSCDYFFNKGDNKDTIIDGNTDKDDKGENPGDDTTPGDKDDKDEGKYAGNAPENYTLKWEDEFDGTALNLDNWEPQIGEGSRYGVYRWGNNEQQYYLADNAVVKNGELHIVGKKENHVSADRGEDKEETFHYTSARLRTKAKVTTLYGYIESRIKMPAGEGLWPAFWMLPEHNYEGKGWPTSGEIDIMEARGRILDKVGSTTHSATSSWSDAYYNKDYTFTDSDITSYHTYGVEWLEDTLNFFVDGINFFTVTSSTYQNGNNLYSDDDPSAPFNQPFHILLNMAIGGNYDGNRMPPNDFSSAEMLVDYVRIFEKKTN